MDNFYSRTKPVGPCLEWTGPISIHGYPVFNSGRSKIPAHRRAWQLEKGEIPNGKILHHKCGNKRCVLIDHLQLTTRSEHMSSIHHFTTAATSASAKKRRNQKFCKYGHEYTTENTVWAGAGRSCRKCRNYYGMLYKRRKRLEGTYRW